MVNPWKTVIDWALPVLLVGCATAGVAFEAWQARRDDVDRW